MLRKSNSSGGGGGTKRTQALLKHHSKPHTGSLSAGSTKTWDMGRNSKNPLSSMGLTSHLVGAPGADPEYVMQLVNDVRWFADVLHNLKEAFHCKGEICASWNVAVFVQEPPRSVKQGTLSHS